MHKKEFPVDDLTSWFLENKRNFPWRESPSPYAVWVSEVMLQQTRAPVVIDYFTRWMSRFPTIEALANSSIDEVIKAWEGLGYYARARNLWKGARHLLLEHRGQLPESKKELQQVKGLGPYTVGAILSFAFGQKAAAVDGNVLRVLSRFFCMEKNIDTPGVQKEIRALVEEILPDKQPWLMMEALIELGALICGKKPNCTQCPLQDRCLAVQLGKEEVLPVKKLKAPPTPLVREVLVLYNEEAVLVQQHEGKKVMSGLYEFPYFEEGHSLEKFYSAPLTFYKKLKTVVHTFTRYRAELIPSIWVTDERREVEGFAWKERTVLPTLPFSSGHKKILGQLQEEYALFTYGKL